MGPRLPLLAASLSAAVLILFVGLSGAAAPRTEVVGWSPFGQSGTIKTTLRIEPLGRGGCIPGPSSEAIGNLGYRCTAGNVLADPCWRNGAKPTDTVICGSTPWDARVGTIRVPTLMLSSGVTFAAPVDCILQQGAHDAVTLPGGNGRRLVVDYSCLRSGTVLLRDLSRGQPWRITSAKWTGHEYRLLGKVVVRRAIFGSLPPPMLKQNALARSAARAAPFSLGNVARVRLAFPALNWAYVESFAGFNVVVHRIDGGWRVVDIRRPACDHKQLSRIILRQLFGCA
jgi:hypothetical protein